VGHEPDLKKRLRELMKWFRDTFEIDNTGSGEERAGEEEEAAALEKKGAAEWKKEAQESRFSVLPDRLMRVIEQKKGTPTQIAQVRHDTTNDTTNDTTRPTARPTTRPFANYHGFSSLCRCAALYR
jgi:hypothetical protein